MKDVIFNILRELRPEFDFIGNEDFINQGMLDSFDIVNLVTALDQYYGISIDGTDIIPDNFESVDSIESLLIKNGAKS